MELLFSLLRHRINKIILTQTTSSGDIFCSEQPNKQINLSNLILNHGAMMSSVQCPDSNITGGFCCSSPGSDWRLLSSAQQPPANLVSYPTMCPEFWPEYQSIEYVSAYLNVLHHRNTKIFWGQSVFRHAFSSLPIFMQFVVDFQRLFF